MVDEQTEEDFRNEMAEQAREQRDTMNAMNQFDNKMRNANKLLGNGDDSSSEEENTGPRRPLTQVEIEKQKNQILMDKLFRA